MFSQNELALFKLTDFALYGRQSAFIGQIDNAIHQLVDLRLSGLYFGLEGQGVLFGLGHFAIPIDARHSYDCFDQIAAWLNISQKLFKLALDFIAADGLAVKIAVFGLAKIIGVVFGCAL